MSDEVKDILFKDLAMRLPYGVVFKAKRKGWANFCSDVMVLCAIDLAPGKFDEMKPILRPLSDLSDQQLYKMGYDLYQIKSCIEDVQQGEIKHVNFMYLIENHYDVSLLIERGIAVDVNTIETDPYK